MPLTAFILLAVICLPILGFACACLSEQPAQVIERVVSSGAALPPLVEVWSLLAVGVVGAALIFGFERRAPSRASPALLQRFLI